MEIALDKIETIGDYMDWTEKFVQARNKEIDPASYDYKSDMVKWSCFFDATSLTTYSIYSGLWIRFHCYKKVMNYENQTFKKKINVSPILFPGLLSITVGTKTYFVKRIVEKIIHANKSNLEFSKDFRSIPIAGISYVSVEGEEVSIIFQDRRDDWSFAKKYLDEMN